MSFFSPEGLESRFPEPKQTRVCVESPDGINRSDLRQEKVVVCLFRKDRLDGQGAKDKDGENKGD